MYIYICTYTLYTYVSGSRLSRFPPFEWYGSNGMAPGFARPEADNAHKVSSITSDQTPHVNGLQCFARHADPDSSLEQCSQPLSLCFEALVNSNQF